MPIHCLPGFLTPTGLLPPWAAHEIPVGALQTGPVPGLLDSWPPVLPDCQHFSLSPPGCCAESARPGYHDHCPAMVHSWNPAAGHDAACG